MPTRFEDFRIQAICERTALETALLMWRTCDPRPPEFPLDFAEARQVAEGELGVDFADLNRAAEWILEEGRAHWDRFQTDPPKDS